MTDLNLSDFVVRTVKSLFLRQTRTGSVRIVIYLIYHRQRSLSTMVGVLSGRV